MPSDKQCCVPGCRDSRDMHVALHLFPDPDREGERFHTWLSSIGGDILGLENAFIHKYRRVCRVHFENKYLCRNNRLSQIAVPTLHLPDLNLPSQPLEESIPLQSLENQSIPSTLTGFKSVSQPCQGMIPWQNLENQPSQYTSTGIKTYIRTSRLSREERKLQIKITAAKRNLLKLNNKIKRQRAEIKAGKKFAANTAKIIMASQWREDKKNKQGRRFKLEEKIVALSIFKQSPKAYRILRKIFILPSRQTLIKLIQMCNLIFYKNK